MKQPTQKSCLIDQYHPDTVKRRGHGVGSRKLPIRQGAEAGNGVVRLGGSSSSGGQLWAEGPGRIPIDEPL